MSIRQTAALFGIKNPNALNKAEELFRLISLKTTFPSKNQMVKTIISIDCAASIYNCEFNVDTAIERTRLSRKDYARMKKTFEKVLNIGTPIDINIIAAELQLSEKIKSNAIYLLNKYKEHNEHLSGVNTSHLMMMAIYQSCKLAQFKNVDGKKIVTKLCNICKLDKKIWNKCENDWNNWMEQYLLKHTGKTITQLQKQNNIVSMVEQKNVEQKITEMSQELEPYEMWRDRMLKKASQNRITSAIQ